MAQEIAIKYQKNKYMQLTYIMNIPWFDIGLLKPQMCNYTDSINCMHYQY